MSTPASKRRKLDNSSKLSQPFKSPFKTPLKGAKVAKDTDTNTGSPSTLLSPKPAADNTPTLSTSNSLLTTASLGPPLSSPAPPPTDPTNLDSSLYSFDLQTLQRQHTRLTTQLSVLRATLDTHTQALRVESSGSNSRLMQLVKVWKSASRAAAEEIFGGVRDRVNRMGGVRALRERERVGGWGRGWEDEKKEVGDGDGDEREEVRDEVDRREDGARREDDDEDEDEDAGYTMPMMLKSLNIDLAMIGYDKETQRWID